MARLEGALLSPEPLIPTNFMVIIGGPTASGKSTLINAFCKNYPWVHKIVSCTTRPQRPKEVEGVDYHFLTGIQYEARKEDFVFETEREIDGETFYYGMDKKELTAIARGEATICHIDLASLEKLPQILNEAFSDPSRAQACMKLIIPIYLGVPHLAILKKRYFMRHREGDKREAFLKRLRTEWEIWQKLQHKIPHTIMNDQSLDKTIEAMVVLINQLA